MIREVCAQGQVHGGLRFYGYRYEIVVDGAGDKHWNLQGFFEPTVHADTLDPNNLNGAEQGFFGNVLSEEERAKAGIGNRERRL